MSSSWVCLSSHVISLYLAAIVGVIEYVDMTTNIGDYNHKSSDGRTTPEKRKELVNVVIVGVWVCVISFSLTLALAFTVDC